MHVAGAAKVKSGQVEWVRIQLPSADIRLIVHVDDRWGHYIIIEGR
jgi:hypothetical protein